MKKLKLEQLKELAKERFGSGAFMLAEKEVKEGERGAMNSKKPWIRLLQRSTTAEDLIELANHRQWQQSIQKLIGDKLNDSKPD
ncbi:MAG: hypothetical protein KME19_11020 [Microcoleus vaginatus WJT46-NPBG5]|jgi:hypothetical protein|nr:hypothetical protein [Microcoleus vaginatus WJT46-NPBG5]